LSYILKYDDIVVTCYGECCRHHLVGQQVVSDISVVRVEVFLACVVNLILLISHYACSLLYLERLTMWRCVYLVTLAIDKEFNLMTSLHLINTTEAAVKIVA